MKQSSSQPTDTKTVYFEEGVFTVTRSHALPNFDYYHIDLRYDKQLVESGGGKTMRQAFDDLLTKMGL